ncbi:MAG TPA: serine/threonine phosphatase, partial [Pantoea agglomerans]|nr:serine/threonine phosphatase [Pantoea agglomerans]
MKIVFASRCQQGLRDENQDRTGAELDERKA